MMSSDNKSYGKGFTLIELMIAILVGFIVVAAVLTIYFSTVRGSSNTLKMSRLNQDLGLAMLIMTNDIRRAGYWGGALPGGEALFDNPFLDVEVRNIGAVALQVPVVGAANGVSGNCITYSYDANAWPNAAYNIADSDAPEDTEYFGFRFSNNAIQIKTQTADAALEPASGCGNGTWVNLTDPDEVTVTDLNFELRYDFQATSLAGIVTSRVVEISITAESTSDDTIVANMSDIVKIRNNLVEPSP